MATDRIEVTATSLASALEDFHVEVTSPFEGLPGAANVDGVIADPDGVGEVLFATLTRMAALREPGPGTSAPEPPVVTHSYEYGDGELRVIESVLGALAGLGKDAEERVMSYVAWRLGYLIYPDGDDD